MSTNLTNFDESMIEFLKDSDTALGLLNEILDYEDQDAELSYETLLLYLKYAILTHDNLSKLTKESGLTKKTLQSIIAQKESPRLSSFFSLLNSINIQTQVDADTQKIEVTEEIKEQEEDSLELIEEAFYTLPLAPPRRYHEEENLRA